MIFDYRNDPFSEIEVDLCIIGAGPAGITIAREFLNTSVTVCVLESGGMNAEANSQMLCEGTSVGQAPFNAAACRLRAFGGSTNVWGGGCIPLSHLDFECREWVPHSGWPLSYEQLQPFYSRARSLLRIDGHDFGEGSFHTAPARKPPSFDEDKLVNRNFVLSPVYFAETYGEDLRRAPNIQVFLHVNALQLESCPDARSVRQVQVSSLHGQRGTVRAKQYVLASGGIENARLLLLSDSVAKAGLGNDRDLVGRYFMDHPSGILGTLTTGASEQVTWAYNRKGGKGVAPAFPELCLSEPAQRGHRLLSSRVRPIAVEGPVPRGVRALRDLRKAMRKPSRDDSMALEGKIHTGTPGMAGCGAPQPAARTMGSLALDLGGGFGDVARAMLRKRAGKPLVETERVDVVGFFEQAPNPDSRITLGQETDALGQRKVRIDWRLTPLDWHTYRTAASMFGSELARACNGRFELQPWLANGRDESPQIQGTAHHIGTTRMAEHPSQGVVDLNSRVHGMSNLYVAGSSVFPTGGWAFPTFTLVSMSLRLADHLRPLL
ncbi:GMC oxidoreductase [Pseudoxanthomonas sp. UTMC 1351]|uniref:GMC oxidoreductase n=1 Tax=Pseudoxanthomonas sp. UTMC 1351 TaxID=2695853 RepID=UPI0034D01309